MIVEAPLATLRKIAVGMFTFWYQMTGRLTSLVAAAIAATTWLLALTGRRRARAESKPSWLLWLPIVSMNVVVALLCSLGRYSMPVVPCLMVLAAFGVDTLLVRRAPGTSGPMGRTA